MGIVLSFACKTKVEAPAAVGVPEMVPAELRVRPGGRVPEARVH